MDLWFDAPCAVCNYTNSYTDTRIETRTETRIETRNETRTETHKYVRTDIQNSYITDDKIHVSAQMHRLHSFYIA